VPFPHPQKVTKETFGEDEFKTLLTYIFDKVKYLKARTRGMRETLIPKWVKTYRGIPAEDPASWPWPGAANLVIQVAATHSDELLSRVMTIYQNDPVFIAKILGDFDPNDNEFGGEPQREMLEQFLTDIAYEPEELDLYRVEETGFSSAIRYGTGIFKFPWEYVVEKQPVYIGGGTEEGTKANFQTKDYTRRDGPHPEAIPLADWGIDPKFATLAESDFHYHTHHLNKHQVINKFKAHSEIFDAACVDHILASPDPIPEYRRQIENMKKMDQNDEGDLNKNWDIEECWFTYQKGTDIYRMIAFYHLQSETCIGIILNPYPENIEPFEDAKLAYDSEEYYGYGFCEMLESYQREISSTHNWRTNSRHFATTGVGRINKNSNLSSVVELFPGVLIPADKDEIEPLAFGVQALNYGVEDEEWTWKLASARAGVDPATGGAGGGVVNSKRGIYSAQGTSVAMQQMNNRNNLRSSDMKSCHVRIGRKLLMMYSHFGYGNKLRKYADRSELLKKALESYKEKKLGLVIRPVTASMNKELEKQNDILLSMTLERMYQSDAQLVQALVNPGCPQELKQLFTEQLKAKQYLMKTLLHNFDHPDAARLIPVPEFLKTERKNAINGSPAINGRALQQPGQAQTMVPTTNGSATIPVSGSTEVQ